MLKNEDRGEITMLNPILKSDTKTLYKALNKILQGLTGKPTMYDGENYIFHRSELSPICLVAHIDTVRKNDTICLEQKGAVIRNRKGVLGADDRAGVFGILSVLFQCNRYGIEFPSVLFTNYEEIGGVGVKKFINDLDEDPFENTNLLIELDRKGANEYVYYSSFLPDEVVGYVESYGFIEGYGSYSDIADLTEVFLVPSVNLSIGYYNQHTPDERLHVDEMKLTISRVFEMVKNPIQNKYLVEEHFFEDRFGFYGEEWEMGYAGPLYVEDRGGLELLDED